MSFKNKGRFRPGRFRKGSFRYLASISSFIKFSDYFNRSVVAFAGNKREFGTSAKEQQKSNVRNTINNLKRSLIHRSEQSGCSALKVFPGPVSFIVSYKNDTQLFDTVQILAMLLSKLKSYAEIAINQEQNSGCVAQITGCVIAVPLYFNEFEKKALLLAAGVAGLDCYHLIKETTAAALHYGLYATNKKQVTVAFVDFGHSAIQVSVCVFYEDMRLEVLAEAFDLIGGSNIDTLLADEIIKQLNRPGADGNNHAFYSELLDETEKLKKKMSANTESFTFSLVFEGETVSASMKRSQMEEICQPLFERFENILRKCLEESKVSLDDIFLIETVGGSNRIPAVKQLIQKVFKKAPVAAKNQDEVVSRGCLLSSIVSNNKRKAFTIMEKHVGEEELESEVLLKIKDVSNPNC